MIDRHSDPVTGVRRVDTMPPTVGQCSQCHVTHGDEFGATQVKELFTENRNSLCYTRSAGGCHDDRPLAYPARESDRMPEGTPYPGYFETNLSGVRRVGNEFRTRWPGSVVYESGVSAPGGRYFSPHRNDPDMPRQDDAGIGLCLNCHDPHGSENPFDHLVSRYVNGGGSGSVGPPANFQLCFDCHSSAGPVGMEPESRLIADFYDRSQNPDNHAGHQIRKNSEIAMSWPSSVRVGDMLSCSDCHNPHGSRGADGVHPNAFLISDERPEWYGITDPLNDAAQSRRFCFGCHIPSDGVSGSKTVRGIVMRAIPDKDEHRVSHTMSCADAHDMRDYFGPRSYNVHHPRIP